MSLDFQPVSNVSLSRQVAEQIREAIINGDLQADQRLPSEEELTKRFNVSRPTIREALKLLAAQNLVRSRRGPSGGTFINRPDPKAFSAQLASTMQLLAGMGEFSLDDISTARRELESLCCRLAATHREQTHLAQMEQELVLQRQEKLTAEEFCASDVRFHRTVADASGNSVIRLLMFSLLDALQPVANMVSFRYRERAVIVDQHQRLLVALTQRDADTAVNILEEQIDYLHEQQVKAQASRQQT